MNGGWLGRNRGWRERSRKDRFLSGLSYGAIMGTITSLFWLWWGASALAVAMWGVGVCVVGGFLFVLLSNLNARGGLFR
jgi:hypothetical protein